MRILHKTATINARIEPVLKRNAENILERVGLTSAEAIRLFYTQICLRRGLPFNVELLNKKTLDAMYEADMGKSHKAKNVKELFKNLD